MKLSQEYENILKEAGKELDRANLTPEQRISVVDVIKKVAFATVDAMTEVMNKDIELIDRIFE